MNEQEDKEQETRIKEQGCSLIPVGTLSPGVRFNLFLERFFAAGKSQVPILLENVILRVHAGKDPGRKDKLYNRLNEMIDYLQLEGYKLKTIDQLLH